MIYSHIAIVLEILAFFLVAIDVCGIERLRKLSILLTGYAADGMALGAGFLRNRLARVLAPVVVFILLAGFIYIFRHLEDLELYYHRQKESLLFQALFYVSCDILILLFVITCVAFVFLLPYQILRLLIVVAIRIMQVIPLKRALLWLGLALFAAAKILVFISPG